MIRLFIFFFCLLLPNYSSAIITNWDIIANSKARIISNNDTYFLEVVLSDNTIVYFDQNQESQASIDLDFYADGKRLDIKTNFPVPQTKNHNNEKKHFYKKSILIGFDVSNHQDQKLIAKLSYVGCNITCSIINHNITFTAHNNFDFEAKRIIERKLGALNSNWFYFLYAFLGGMVLNLMPCVLPILLLKLKQISELQTNKDNCTNILANISGIIATYGIVGVATAIIKYLGHQIGFGYHFQNIYFLILLSFVLVFAGCAIIGNVTVGLPSLINNYLDINARKLIKNFFTGVVTAILATPCVAPFLTVALGFVLIASYLEIFFIFVFTGAGLAFPYVLILIFPRVINFFPTPGPWMNNFKKILSLMMFASAIWLLYIINIKTGLWFSILIFGILLLFKFFLGEQKILAKYFVTKLLALSLLICIALYSGYSFKADQREYTKNINSFWEYPESDKIFFDHKNQVILIDVTADWCMTCKVNHLLNFTSKKHINNFQKLGIKAIRYDITNNTPSYVYELMKKHGRNGIPFNLLLTESGKYKLLGAMFSHAEIVKKIDELQNEIK